MARSLRRRGHSGAAADDDPQGHWRQWAKPALHQDTPRAWLSFRRSRSPSTPMHPVPPSPRRRLRRARPATRDEPTLERASAPARNLSCFSWHRRFSSQQRPVPRRTPPPLFSRPPHFVGRDAELAQLTQWWTTAQQGCAAGRVHRGGSLESARPPWSTRSSPRWRPRRTSRSGAANAWITTGRANPICLCWKRWDASAATPREIGSCPACATTLRVGSRTCPPCCRRPTADALARTTHDVTPAQMLRELTDALEVLTAARPLVLVLEDLHWSDRATLAWLAYLARRRDPAHVLILGTYRPGEVLGHAHPLRPLLAELQPHAQCVELVLDPLSAPAVAAYLSQRCTATTLPASLPQLIHQRTSGHPLFLVAMVDELVREKLLETAGEAAAEPGQPCGPRASSSPRTCGSTSSSISNGCPMRTRRCSKPRASAGSTFAVAAVAAGVAQAPQTHRSALCGVRPPGAVHTGQWHRDAGPTGR